MEKPQITMKAEVYYFTKKAFHENPHVFFMDAKVTQKMLDESGLQNFCKVGEHQTDSNISKDDFAEEIFALFNLDNNPLGTSEGQEKIRSLGVSHTSMSINDFIVIDGDVLIVDGCGFLNIGKHKSLSNIVA